MARYIAQRLVRSFGVILAIVTVVFFAMRATGNPLVAMETQVGVMTPEETIRLRKLLGIDQPVWLQYVEYLRNLIVGDYGISFRRGQPAMRLVLESLPRTALLAGGAVLIATCVGLPAGLLAAVRRGRRVDGALCTLMLAASSIPGFWLGLILIWVFSVRLGWFPPGGSDGWRSVVLPSVSLSTYTTAVVFRLTRAQAIEVLEQDWIRTARSKGMSEGRVVMMHVIRNAAVPVTTMLGLQFGLLLGGAAIIEQVFSWPGVGRLAIDAAFARDYPVIQSALLVVAVIFVVINVLLDLAYPAIDPRIRLRGNS